MWVSCGKYCYIHDNNAKIKENLLYITNSTFYHEIHNLGDTEANVNAKYDFSVLNKNICIPIPG